MPHHHALIILVRVFTFQGLTFKETGERSRVEAEAVASGCNGSQNKRGCEGKLSVKILSFLFDSCKLLCYITQKIGSVNAIKV